MSKSVRPKAGNSGVAAGLVVVWTKTDKRIEECNLCICNSEGDSYCSVEGNRTEHSSLHWKLCICNRKYVTKAQHYTSWVTGHTKTTQKYNIDVGAGCVY